LLACALGYNQDEPIKQLSEKIKTGVRIDQGGVMMTDYHTVGGGYNTPQLLTAEGKPKKSSGKPHTEITERAYLHDASFLVAIRADENTIKQLAEAVQNPHWVIYLGRKACPPSRPLFEGVGDYASLETALQNWNWYNPRIEKATEMQKPAVLESDSIQADVIRRRHRIISRARRIYGACYLQQKPLTIQAAPGFPPLPDPKGFENPSGLIQEEA
jgi:CRISPR system Cascade subunit CasD